MAKTKPRAMTVEEFIRSVTMFYIDNDLEESFSSDVTTSVNKIRTDLLGVAIPDGLKQYIRDDKDALDHITSLLNISEEKFKRIITMLRLQKRHMPTSEWPLSEVRKQMIEHPDFMQEVCDLLTVGASMDKYNGLIPAYYLENFKIDASTLGRLANEDDVRRLVKKGFEGRYSNKIGDSFFKSASGVVTSICGREGLTYSIKKPVPLLNRVVSIAIPDESSPRILIDITYGITTSSTQTKYAEREEAAASKIRDRNTGKLSNQKITFINVVDGAGWVARRSDLEKIHRCSDYLLNLNTLASIESIIQYYFN
jgi:hypothetical protein